MTEIKWLETDLYEIESLTHPGIKYIVDLAERTCTCPGFKFRGTCKHPGIVFESLKETEIAVEKNFWPSEI